VSGPTFARWQQATHDSHGAQPGARVLMAALLARFAGVRSWGIYSVRNTVLGNLSAHSEGRALDVACAEGVGEKLVRYLLALGPWKLGISVMIHDGRIYSARSPHGRPYAGDPHRDHVHIEMTRKAASHLRLKRAKRVLTWDP
jgi:hypothetical protein